MHHLSNLPVFLTWFTLGTGLFLIFSAVYLWATPWPEIRMIRTGNIAATTSFSGAALGYTAVLYTVLSHSASREGLVVWGVIGLLVQLGAFLLARFILGGANLTERMNQGQISSGIFLGVISLVAGGLTSACMVP